MTGPSRLAKMCMPVAPPEPREATFGPHAGGYGERVGDRLVTTLVPLLSEPTGPEFNLFQVLHHGTHEKQISNLFAWLLDPQGTHRLGEMFQRIFIDQVARSRPGALADDGTTYSVRQEVNTSSPDDDQDIADIVLESDTTVIVVENYHVSDGHGHNYRRYRDFGHRHGKKPVVVMLCGTSTPGALVDDWEEAALVTYASLLEQLTARVKADQAYKAAHPQQCFFFDQMYSHFVRGRNVNDNELIAFIGALCNSGDASYYQQSPDSKGAVNFADSLRERALEQFNESRDLLWRAKAALQGYCATTLKNQINEALSDEFIVDVKANQKGIYQWTIVMRCAGETDETESVLLIKFGPSAWYANERDVHWGYGDATGTADYSRLFLTWDGKIRQSEVSIEQVLEGMATDDLRLRDAALDMIRV